MFAVCTGHPIPQRLASCFFRKQRNELLGLAVSTIAGALTRHQEGGHFAPNDIALIHERFSRVELV